MQRLTIIGTAKSAFDKVIKDIAGVVDCEFLPLDAALEAPPGQFTLIDIDLEHGARLVELKDWLAARPSGARVVFITDKSSHLQDTRASAVGGTDVSELTTHGDHLYYDRLKASPDSSIQTSLRFDEKAAADANGDGEITLAELDAAPIDVTTYDPSGFDAPTLGAFMKALARTVGHFRGEGECTVSRIE